MPVGLLINFNVAYLSDGGVKRIINGKYEAADKLSRVEAVQE